MKEVLEQLIQLLQEQLGHHRKLLECLRLEKEALENFDTQSIQTHTLEKESILQSIQESEKKRLKSLLEWSVKNGKSESTMVISDFIEIVQNDEPLYSEQLRSLQSSLRLILKRVAELNESNGILVAGGLRHIEEMKKNALGVVSSPAAGYTAHGTRKVLESSCEGRLISEEA